ASHIIRTALEESEHYKTKEIMAFDERMLKKSKALYQSLEHERKLETEKIGKASQLLVQDVLQKVLPASVVKSLQSTITDQEILDISIELLKRRLTQKEG